MERFKGENQKRIQGTLDNQLREQRHMTIVQIGNTWLASGFTVLGIAVATFALPHLVLWASWLLAFVAGLI